MSVYDVPKETRGLQPLRGNKDDTFKCIKVVWMTHHRETELTTQ